MSDYITLTYNDTEYRCVRFEDRETLSAACEALELVAYLDRTAWVIAGHTGGDVLDHYRRAIPKPALFSDAREGLAHLSVVDARAVGLTGAIYTMLPDGQLHWTDGESIVNPTVKSIGWHCLRPWCSVWDTEPKPKFQTHPLDVTFIRLWDIAKGNPGYIKADWMAVAGGLNAHCYGEGTKRPATPEVEDETPSDISEEQRVENMEAMVHLLANARRWTWNISPSTNNEWIGSLEGAVFHGREKEDVLRAMLRKLQPDEPYTDEETIERMRLGLEAAVESMLADPCCEDAMSVLSDHLLPLRSLSVGLARLRSEMPLRDLG